MDVLDLIYVHLLAIGQLLSRHIIRSVYIRISNCFKVRSSKDISEKLSKQFQCAAGV